MKTTQHVTHSFDSPLARDLFTLGVETMLASKEAVQGHAEALERQERLLEEMSMIAEPPPEIILSDEEIAEMARYEEARRGRVNYHDA